MTADAMEDREATCAGYVAGTMSAAERAAFEHELASDAVLQACVYAWQDRLLGLVDRVPPRAPAAGSWERIERSLGAGDGPRVERLRTAGAAVGAAIATSTDRSADRPANDPWWGRVATWRALSGLALAALLVLAVLLTTWAMRPQVERFVAVLQSPADRTTGWLVEASTDAGVRLVPIGDVAPAPAGRALQFWTKPVGAGGPTSLGLVVIGRTAVVPQARLPGLSDQQLFEVTLEPEGGSPIGKPTGPILYVGRAVHWS